MSEKFVSITKEDFENFLLTINKDYKITTVPGWEFVYDIPMKENLSIFVYSSIDKRSKKSRDSGADSIKLLGRDTFNNVSAGKTIRIYRTAGWDARIYKAVETIVNELKNYKSVEPDYLMTILKSFPKKEFAMSLLANLEKHGKLTANQLKYVIGNNHPKGYKTFETLYKENQAGVDFSTEEVILDTGLLNESDFTLEPPANRAKRKTKIRIKKFDNPEVVGSDISNIELIATTEYPQYKFTHFNPVQSLVFERKENDRNMIVAANTSAGKTVCGEILMKVCFQAEKSVIYLSPLKSLTQEKYDDWRISYPDKKIVIMTGDYALTDEKKKDLDEANIIVMTSEMCDSRTRKFRSERNRWMKKVGLVIVDESHILTTERGHAVEAGIMRFTLLNPGARILLLSATMPNVSELGEWLSALNFKKTDVINCSWRPITLNVNFIEYSSDGNYQQVESEKRKTALRIVNEKPDEKYLVFVHSKAAGHKIISDLKRDSIEAEFHSADLQLNDRLEIERRFEKRQNGLNVLVSTSTLAWGRNLPARNVIIVGIHRGLTEVDELDIIQMAGRAGRFGIDDAGFVNVIIPPGETIRWSEIFKNPRPCLSVLNNPDVLAFHVLSEIQTRSIRSERTLFAWYKRSLAFIQEQKEYELWLARMDSGEINLNPEGDVEPKHFMVDDAKELLEKLEKIEMITNFGRMETTGLGNVSAWLYFTPFDIYSWYRNISEILKKGFEVNDETLSWAISHCPSFASYIPKEYKGLGDAYHTNFNNKYGNFGDGLRIHHDHLFTTIALNFTLDGVEMTGALAGAARGIVWDINRIVTAIKMSDNRYARWNLQKIWETLPIRFKYGISAEMTGLVEIPGVGGKRAKILYEAGYTSIKHIVDPIKRNKLFTLFTPKIAQAIIHNSKKLLDGE